MLIHVLDPAGYDTPVTLLGGPANLGLRLLQLADRMEELDYAGIRITRLVPWSELRRVALGFVVPQRQEVPPCGP